MTSMMLQLKTKKLVAATRRETIQPTTMWWCAVQSGVSVCVVCVASRAQISLKRHRRRRRRRHQHSPGRGETRQSDLARPGASRHHSLAAAAHIQASRRRRRKLSRQCDGSRRRRRHQTEAIRSRSDGIGGIFAGDQWAGWKDNAVAAAAAALICARRGRSNRSDRPDRRRLGGRTLVVVVGGGGRPTGRRSRSARRLACSLCVGTHSQAQIQNRGVQTRRFQHLLISIHLHLI
jgi:hypothetical protein